MSYRKSFAETSREIIWLVKQIKYNPHHGADGRFSTSDDAHLVVARDGTRTLGPKHPDFHQRVEGKVLDEKSLLAHPEMQKFLNGDVPYGSSDKGGDRLLQALYKIQGFDGKPHVVNDLQPYIAKGEVEGFRGITGGNGAYEKQFMEGDYHAGHGIFGNGTYIATDSSVGYGHDHAEDYERANTLDEAKLYVDKQGLMNLTIKKGANYGDYEKLVEEAGTQSKIHEKNIATISSQFGKLSPKSPKYKDLLKNLNKEALLLTISKDVGAYATTKGYDGYHVSDYAMHGMNIYSSTHTVVLNRTSVRVAKSLIKV